VMEEGLGEANPKGLFGVLPPQLALTGVAERLKAFEGLLGAGMGCGCFGRLLGQCFPTEVMGLYSEVGRLKWNAIISTPESTVQAAELTTVKRKHSDLRLQHGKTQSTLSLQPFARQTSDETMNEH
jgi:hypothetical protein